LLTKTKKISDEKDTSRRGEASGQNLLDKSRQSSPGCFAPPSNAEYLASSLSEIISSFAEEKLTLQGTDVLLIPPELMITRKPININYHGR
jgi:hypothetical protein